jgi:hypothetical protein
MRRHYLLQAGATQTELYYALILYMKLLNYFLFRTTENVLEQFSFRLLIFGVFLSIFNCLDLWFYKISPGWQLHDVSPIWSPLNRRFRHLRNFSFLFFYC